MRGILSRFNEYQVQDFPVEDRLIF